MKRGERSLADFAEDYKILKRRELTNAEMAKVMGYRPRTVGRLATRARAAGLLPHVNGGGR